MSERHQNPSSVALAERVTTPGWSLESASELYGVERWGAGYFSVGERGTVQVHPSRERSRAIDLERLVTQLLERGIGLPILLRFGGILEDRIRSIDEAFRIAIRDHEYKGGFFAVYPIKVNQQRQVVEEIQRFGRPFGHGLEAGSKAELLAVLAIADNETPIVCNGFKDHEYIETVVLAQKIGRNIIPVVERFRELDMLLEHSKRHDTRPRLGVRVKLATKGAGRWKESAGYRSKFGLTATEAIAAVDRLQREGAADGLELLHFHMGSQITNIRQVKSAVGEAARLYAELRRLGAGLQILDVGGGLGVDYDGSQTDFESSINYTLQEYANDVVYHVQSVCDDAGLPHPTIVTECGRALTAYHSVLVFDVLGASQRVSAAVPEQLDEEAPQPLWDLMETRRSLSSKNLIECFHDAQQALEEALNLFRLGYLDLEGRGIAETLFWMICAEIRRLATRLDYLPEELEELDSLLAETYFCNMSVFQSLPDSWAIKQLFPIMPIHRLGEEPKLHAILADISCDSDGKIDRFIDLRDVKRHLPVHELSEEPYYMAAFLIGAYQEILGDLHNLFGDTNAVHVGCDEDGEVVIDEVVEGDTVREVLHYVQFDAGDLLKSFRRDVEAAVRQGRLTAAESGRLLRFYEAGLQGYTYLEEDSGPNGDS